MTVASADFPRGTTASVETLPTVTASITIPALPGIAHVLDNVSAKLMSTVATTLLVTMTSSAGTYTGFVLMLLSCPASGTDSGEVSGINLATAPGESLTISFSTSNAGSQEFLLAQWHEI